MAESSLPRDDHFDEVLKAAERIQSAPPLPPPIPRSYMTPLADPPPYAILGAIGVTMRVITVLELLIGTFTLVGAIGMRDSTLIVPGIGMILGSPFVLASGEAIDLLRDMAQNSFRQTAILERQFGSR